MESVQGGIPLKRARWRGVQLYGDPSAKRPKGIIVLICRPFLAKDTQLSQWHKIKLRLFSINRPRYCNK